MDLANFLVMIAAFTAGISGIVLMIGLAKRIGAGGGAAAGAVHALRDEVELLRGQVDRLRSDVEHTTRPPELEEIQNRLDFAERMLAQIKGRDALPGPRPGTDAQA